MKKYKLVIIIIICVLLISVLIFLAYFSTKENESTKSTVGASDATDQVTSQVDWELGTTSNIDSSDSGTIKISDYAISEIDMMAIYNEDASNIYLKNECGASSPPETAKTNPIDGNVSTYFLANELCNSEDPESAYWRIDLQYARNIKKIRYQSNVFWVGGDNTGSGGEAEGYWAPPGLPYFSEDHMSEYILDDPVSLRYIFLGSGIDEKVFEFEIYEVGGTATHTTAATQIDGQEGSADKDLVEWTSFTPTQTTPLNTSISYEFRTSADGSDWSAWSASQTYSGSPLDLTGLTANRYLQVRSTLSTTDALSTPQIDDYTINFHNNEAPSQPTAQTAVTE